MIDRFNLIRAISNKVRNRPQVDKGETYERKRVRFAKLKVLKNPYMRYASDA
jgi:hypothetical protein